MVNNVAIKNWIFLLKVPLTLFVLITINCNLCFVFSPVLFCICPRLVFFSSVSWRPLPRPTHCFLNPFHRPTRVRTRRVWPTIWSVVQTVAGPTHVPTWITDVPRWVKGSSTRRLTSGATYKVIWQGMRNWSLLLVPIIYNSIPYTFFFFQTLTIHIHFLTLFYNLNLKL